MRKELNQLYTRLNRLKIELTELATRAGNVQREAHEAVLDVMKSLAYWNDNDIAPPAPKMEELP